MRVVLRYAGAKFFLEIMEKILRVVAQTPTVRVPSGLEGETSKCTLVLQEMGGKWENTYAVTMFGELAEARFEPGQMVAAVLRMSAHEFNNQWYQDVMVRDIVALKTVA